MRIRVLLVVLLAAALALGGCIQGDPGYGKPGAPGYDQNASGQMDQDEEKERSPGGDAAGTDAG